MVLSGRKRDRFMDAGYGILNDLKSGQITREGR
jgi:hypothetical protein